MEEVPRTWPPIAKLLSSSLPESLLASPPMLAPLKLAASSTRISGPHSTSDEGNGCDFVYGYSASSYPVNPNAKQAGEKYGDPIADGFMGIVYPNCAVLCVTDGCGWGNKARLASRFALASFVDHVSSRLLTVIDLESAASLLLDAIKAAHAAVFLTAADFGGLTTLLGGIVLPVQNGSSIFLSINLGDCKGFAWDGTVVYDITPENRGNANNPTDPGGVLGPSDGSHPDLRNLRLYYYACNPKDHIVLVSDGVHDTYDPEARGMLPEECGIKGAAWKDVTSAELEKDRARCKLMGSDLSRLAPEARTAMGVARALVDACIETTKSSRQFMEANPTKRQPQDARLYPGKMDHTTALVYAVTAAPRETLPLPLALPANLRVLISGASGFLGKHLVAACKAKGYTVAKLVRTQPAADSPDIFWDIPNQKVDTAKLATFSPHVVVHLSGENMFGLWTEWKKKEIYDSRINSTRLLVKVLSRLPVAPEVFLSSSGISAYGRENGDNLLSEDVKGTGIGWVAQICADWEAAGLNLVSISPTTRVAILRTAVVFDANEGPLTLLTRQSKFGFGGTLGSGLQWMPWITYQDWVAAVFHLMHTPALSGPINVCAPIAVQNTALMQAIGEVISRPTWFWVPESIAKFFAGEMADELLLSSLRTVPRRLEETGFKFSHPEVRAALRHLLLPLPPAAAALPRPGKTCACMRRLSIARDYQCLRCLKKLYTSTRTCALQLAIVRDKFQGDVNADHLNTLSVIAEQKEAHTSWISTAVEGEIDIKGTSLQDKDCKLERYLIYVRHFDRAMQTAAEDEEARLANIRNILASKHITPELTATLQRIATQSENHLSLFRRLTRETSPKRSPFEQRLHAICTSQTVRLLRYLLLLLLPFLPFGVRFFVRVLRMRALKLLRLR